MGDVTRFPSFVSAHEQIVVGSFGMPDVSPYSQPDSIFIKLPGCAAASHSSAVFATSVLSNRFFSFFGTAGKQLPDTFRKLFYVYLIHFSPSLYGQDSPFLTPVPVGFTLLLSFVKSTFLDQQPLTFLTFAGPAPLKDHSPQPGILL